MLEEPVRPGAVPSTDRVHDAARRWLRWFGVGRLVATALAVIAVVGGGYLLLRPPTPSAESTLPRATAGSAGGSPAVATDPGHRGVGAGGLHADVNPRRRARRAGTGWSRRPARARRRRGPHARGVPAAGGLAGVDAVDLAGGAVDDGDPDALNLAAVLLDGTRVYVPRQGEVVAPPSLISGPADADGQASPAGPLDVNRVGADELDALPGVGPATAAAIVAERERNGPFSSVDDLDRVPGIGPAKLDALRDLVTT